MLIIYLNLFWKLYWSLYTLYTFLPFENFVFSLTHLVYKYPCTPSNTCNVGRRQFGQLWFAPTILWWWNKVTFLKCGPIGWWRIIFYFVMVKILTFFTWLPIGWWKLQYKGNPKLGHIRYHLLHRGVMRFITCF